MHYRSSSSSHIGLHSLTRDPSLRKLLQQKLQIGKKVSQYARSAVIILLRLTLKVSWKLAFWTIVLCSNMNVTKFCRWCKCFSTSFEERSCTLPKSTDSISRQENIITAKRKIKTEDYRLTFLSNRIRKKSFWFRFSKSRLMSSFSTIVGTLYSIHMIASTPAHMITQIFWSLAGLPTFETLSLNPNTFQIEPIKILNRIFE